MRKIVPLVLILFLAACVSHSSNYKIVRKFGGPYDAQLIEERMETQDGREVSVPRIRYFSNFREYRAYFPQDMQPALDFIKNATSLDSVFVCWWDYGHVIRGYTGREVVIDSPSVSIKDTVSSGYVGEFSSEEKIKDVAIALSTTNDEVLNSIMEKYGAEYLYLYKSDGGKAWVIFQAADLDPGNYVQFLSTGNFKTTNLGDQTVLFRIFAEEEINGFEVVYDDGVSKILKLVN